MMIKLDIENRVGKIQHMETAITKEFDREAQKEDILNNCIQVRRRVLEWINLSDSGLKLRCGELTAQEIRTIRAVLNALILD